GILPTGYRTCPPENGTLAVWSRAGWHSRCSCHRRGSTAPAAPLAQIPVGLLVGSTQRHSGTAAQRHSGTAAQRVSRSLDDRASVLLLLGTRTSPRSALKRCAGHPKNDKECLQERIRDNRSH